MKGAEYIKKLAIPTLTLSAIGVLYLLMIVFGTMFVSCIFYTLGGAFVHFSYGEVATPTRSLSAILHFMFGIFTAIVMSKVGMTLSVAIILLTLLSTGFFAYYLKDSEDFYKRYYC